MRKIWERIGFSASPAKIYPAQLTSAVKSMIHSSSFPGLCFKIERSTLALSLVFLRLNISFNKSMNFFQVKSVGSVKTPMGVCEVLCTISSSTHVHITEGEVKLESIAWE